MTLKKPQEGKTIIIIILLGIAQFSFKRGFEEKQLKTKVRYCTQVSVEMLPACVEMQCNRSLEQS